jgi:hypothetical protein
MTTTTALRGSPSSKLTILTVQPLHSWSTESLIPAASPQDAKDRLRPLSRTAARLWSCHSLLQSLTLASRVSGNPYHMHSSTRHPALVSLPLRKPHRLSATAAATTMTAAAVSNPVPKGRVPRLGVVPGVQIRGREWCLVAVHRKGRGSRAEG